MSYTLTPIDSCHYSIKVPLNPSDVAKQKNTFLMEKQKTVEIKGYRKGKVPLSVVEKFFGEQSKRQAVYSSAWGPIDQAIAKEKLRVVGYPKFEEPENIENLSEISAVLEVVPKYNLKDFKSYQFKSPTNEITNEDIEKVKESLLRSRTEILPKEEGKEVTNGDYATINFTGMLEDGTMPSEMKAEKYSLDVGSNRFIPGFEEQVVGMKVGDVKKFNIIFPRDYHVEKYKEAKVEFEVELLEVKEKIVPTWNEELRKLFGYESEEDFVEKTKERLNDQKKNEAETKLRGEIIDQFLADNEWPVPPTLIQEQKRLLMEEMKKHLQTSRIPEGQIMNYLKTMDQEMVTRAEKQVKTALLVENLAEQLGLRISDEKLNDYFSKMADQHKLTVEELKNYYSTVPKYLENLKFHLLEEAVFDEVKKIVKIEKIES